MEIILIRYTSINVPKEACHDQTDVPLRNGFKGKITVTTQQLQDDASGAVFISSLSRCTRLTEYCGYLGAIRDVCLRELDFGEWGMKEFDKIDDPRLQEWYDDYFHVTAIGGESSIIQLQRVSESLDEVSRRKYGRAAVLVHDGILICAQIYAGTLEMEDAFGALIPYGGIVRLQPNPETAEQSTTPT